MPLETLRQVNASLRCTLLRLSPERNHCLNIQPRDLSGLASQVQRARECLGTLPTQRREDDAALEKEMLEYRSILEKLKRILPDVQVRLLAEKSRIEAARGQLAAAEAWSTARWHALRR